MNLNKKLKLYQITTLVLLLVVGFLIFNQRNFESEIIISSEDLGGYDDTFGSTVAIYVEQTTGEGNYVQKNNVPNDGSVYTVNSATHCIGGVYSI